MERQCVVHAAVLVEEDFSVVEKRTVRAVDFGVTRVHEGKLLLVLQGGVENLDVRRGVKKHLRLQNRAVDPEVLELVIRVEYEAGTELALLLQQNEGAVDHAQRRRQSTPHATSPPSLQQGVVTLALRLIVPADRLPRSQHCHVLPALCTQLVLAGVVSAQRRADADELLVHRRRRLELLLPVRDRRGTHEEEKAPGLIQTREDGELVGDVGGRGSAAEVDDGLVVLRRVEDLRGRVECVLVEWLDGEDEFVGPMAEHWVAESLQSALRVFERIAVERRQEEK